jgi:hypothetical protein
MEMTHLVRHGILTVETMMTMINNLAPFSFPLLQCLACKISDSHFFWCVEEQRQSLPWVILLTPTQGEMKL